MESSGGLAVWTGSVEVELTRDVSSSARARRLVEELCAATVEGVELDTAKLLVSELVTNALVHGQGVITLRMDLDEDRLLVELVDEGSGFAWTVSQGDFGQLGGWGLQLVDAQASRWGLHEGTTHVWFEIERAGPRRGAEHTPDSDSPA